MLLVLDDGSTLGGIGVVFTRDDNVDEEVCGILVWGAAVTKLPKRADCLPEHMLGDKQGKKTKEEAAYSHMQ